MENLIIEKTESSFGIQFDCVNNTLKFEGESRPENCADFFAPLISWIEEYHNYIYFKINEYPDTKIIVTVDFNVDYFNSTSAKYILDLLIALERVSHSPNVTLNVNWHYRSLDEDMLESGEEFADMTGIDINLIAKD